MLRNLAVLVFAVLSTSSILAQTPGNFGRPPGPGTPGYRAPVSPYLNLNRGGNQAINYYGLVRPQVEGTQALQSIEKQIGPGGSPMTIESAVNPTQGLPGVMPYNVTPTGSNVISAAGFMTHRRNFQNAGSTSGGQRQEGPGGMTAPMPLRRQ